MRLLFLFKSEKKTDEGHLKQMREGLRNNYLFIYFLPNRYIFYIFEQLCPGADCTKLMILSVKITSLQLFGVTRFHFKLHVTVSE